MARNKKPLPLLEDIVIDRIAAEGQSIAYWDEMVIFIPFGVPGDRCSVQIVRKKKNYAEGRIVALKEPSIIRITPRCMHFGICGGCKWQHLPYEEQLKAKDTQVRDAMERIAKVPIAEHRPILPSTEVYSYRNKLEFTFSNRRWITDAEMLSLPDTLTDAERAGLGFHIPGKFDKVLDLEHCYLGSDLSDDIRNFVGNFCKERIERYPFFDLREQQGVMRTLMIRTASTGDIMVLVAFAQETKEDRETLLNAIITRFPQITSLLYVINTKCNDTIGDLDVYTFHGKPYIEEQMEDLTFRVGPKSFYQTNSKQAYTLYSVARDLAGLQGTEVVYDLYTGTGTIANFVARKARKVVGIEYVPEAIEDAKLNSSINSIDNTIFYAGDMKDLLTDDFIAREGWPDVVITDPPRAGMHPDVIKTLLRTAPARIVYVSCNPATQARDVALLVEGGYKAVVSQPVDMFPHTHHVENVLLLEHM
ncbi:23S rRNA (uracil(1939)-C(5))-methyltransferase RlmD [Porphyromonas circumdentaria]|uniref:23S rRNA (uracil(1939)-C(5))-methyltransferase RlmD n=1 Tax=Porphyromonas circumdentaria TaxID=29524 RepID=UPI0026DAC971|nr:23S rRNA (uracil(1939)-C(5))-methyltransferase RlmD [Porphyromonas circumdentaria]MDO4722999.1 23S rRNA (uracil(1939)-C(5))-methyltransferase RlmD [Porphyromonas circumdentaria]